MNSAKLKFSIVTPSYNEEKDIRDTLESFLTLSYPNKEIIVVDDSTDKTPEIVREYADRGVRLIHGRKEGCCEAVNLGIEAATGDVIVQADADVRPPKDFLERLAEKYEAGADWVIVDCRLPDWNKKSMFSRFVGALHIMEHPPTRTDMYYTEAFSVRRDVALKLGMFGPSYPARFCRDWILGKKMTESGYKKIYDPSVIVLHPQPDNFKDFWNTRTGRGRFGPLTQYFMFHQPLPLIFLKLIVKDFISALRFITVITAAAHVVKVAKYSDKGLKNFLPFLYVHFLQELARVVGEWQGFKINLSHARRS